MKTYVITENRGKKNTAGAKAPADIAEICKRLGAQEFVMPRFPTGKNKLYQKIWMLISVTHCFSKLKRIVDDSSVVVYQHPMYGNRLVEKMIPTIQKKKGTKFIALIHDLESLRGGIAGIINRSSRTNDVADNSLLKKFDAIICHNEHMRQYLISQGFSSDKVHNLEIFDYLTDIERVQPEKGESPSIAIAGNLAIGKCAYIYKIFENGHNPGLRVNLYGINFQEDNATDNMVYHGSFKPEELPGKLEGDFGLVWDGNSADTCAGNTGEYLRYNNPHKTSLYLASGMPVIVWSQAAIADFVLEKQVGITINSLYEIEEKISNIGVNEYNNMCKNVLEIGRQLRAGYHTQSSIQKVALQWDVLKK